MSVRRVGMGTGKGSGTSVQKLKCLGFGHWSSNKGSGKDISEIRKGLGYGFGQGFKNGFKKGFGQRFVYGSQHRLRQWFGHWDPGNVISVRQGLDQMWVWTKGAEV